MYCGSTREPWRQQREMRLLWKLEGSSLPSHSLGSQEDGVRVTGCARLQDSYICPFISLCQQTCHPDHLCWLPWCPPWASFTAQWDSRQCSKQLPPPLWDQEVAALVLHHPLLDTCNKSAGHTAPLWSVRLKWPHLKKITTARRGGWYAYDLHPVFKAVWVPFSAP